MQWLYYANVFILVFLLWCYVERKMTKPTELNRIEIITSVYSEFIMNFKLILVNFWIYFNFMKTLLLRFTKVTIRWVCSKIKYIKNINYRDTVYTLMYCKRINVSELLKYIIRLIINFFTLKVFIFVYNTISSITLELHVIMNIIMYLIFFFTIWQRTCPCQIIKLTHN